MTAIELSSLPVGALLGGPYGLRLRKRESGGFEGSDGITYDLADVGQISPLSVIWSPA